MEPQLFYYKPDCFKRDLRKTCLFFQYYQNYLFQHPFHLRLTTEAFYTLLKLQRELNGYYNPLMISLPNMLLGHCVRPLQMKCELEITILFWKMMSKKLFCCYFNKIYIYIYCNENVKNTSFPLVM